MQMLMILNIVLYLTWSHLLCRRMRNLSANSSLHYLALPTLLLHAWLLYRSIDTSLGQNLAMVNIASLLSWLMCLLVYLFSRYGVVWALQILTAPIAALAIVGQLLLPHQSFNHQALSVTELSHIFVSLFAFCVLAVSGLQAIFLAWQQRALKHGNSKLALMLPPLDAMEQLLFQLIWAGFISLSLSLLTGLGHWTDLSSAVLLQKVSFAFLAWLVFLVLLFGRHRYGWRGQTAIRLSLAGFALLVCSYVGTRLLLVLQL